MTDVVAQLRAAPVAEHVERAIAALREALARDLHDEADAALLAVPALLEQLTRTTDALRSRVLPVVENQQLWMLEGQRSFTTWTAAATGTTYGRARREVRRARELRDHLPEAARALAEGAIGVDHVDALAQHALSSAPRIAALADADAGEAFLATVAREVTPAQFRRVVRVWAASVDPEAEDRAFREASQQERIGLAQTLGGWHLEGWLSHETGLALRTALDAASGIPSAQDTRTRGQRDAAALAMIARHALDSGEYGGSSRVRPHLLVHVPAETLARAVPEGACVTGEGAGIGEGGDGVGAATADDGFWATDDADAPRPELADPRLLRGAEPATFSDGTPLAPSQLSRFLCSAAVTRVVLGPAGVPLDVGRTKRVFTEAQTKAVIVRDRHCQFPGCSSPPTWCEVHHLVPWAEGGGTDIANAILLCWTHHHELHRARMRVRAEDERWIFTRSDGRLHGATPRRGQGYLRLPTAHLPPLAPPSQWRATIPPGGGDVVRASAGVRLDE